MRLAAANDRSLSSQIRRGLHECLATLHPSDRILKRAMGLEPTTLSLGRRRRHHR